MKNPPDDPERGVTHLVSGPTKGISGKAPARVEHSRTGTMNRAVAGGQAMAGEPMFQRFQMAFIEIAW